MRAQSQSGVANMGVKKSASTIGCRAALNMCPFSLHHVAIIRSIHAASSRPVASSCSVKNRDRTPCFLASSKTRVISANDTAFLNSRLVVSLRGSKCALLAVSRA